jgi:hypothetical protein
MALLADEPTPDPEAVANRQQERGWRYDHSAFADRRTPTPTPPVHAPITIYQLTTDNSPPHFAISSGEKLLCIHFS